MAHTAVKTPTKAAEFIIAHIKAFGDTLLSLEKSIIIRTQQLLARQKQALSSLNQRLTGSVKDYLNTRHQRLQTLSSALVRKPGMLLYEKQRDLESASGKIKSASGYYLKNQQQNLDNFRALFKLLSPENVLKKGFALVKQNGRIISSPDDVHVGNEIAVILAGQEINATVNHKKAYDGNDFNL
jgi:exodeoxyribonuclease VII large subunit